MPYNLGNNIPNMFETAANTDENISIIQDTSEQINDLQNRLEDHVEDGDVVNATATAGSIAALQALQDNTVNEVVTDYDVDQSDITEVNEIVDDTSNVSTDDLRHQLVVAEEKNNEEHSDNMHHSSDHQVQPSNSDVTVSTPAPALVVPDASPIDMTEPNYDTNEPSDSNNMPTYDTNEPSDSNNMPTYDDNDILDIVQDTNSDLQRLESTVNQLNSTVQDLASRTENFQNEYEDEEEDFENNIKEGFSRFNGVSIVFVISLLLLIVLGYLYLNNTQDSSIVLTDTPFME